MKGPLPASVAGRTALDAILARPGDTVIAVDFDGTLAPMTDDPEQAYAQRSAIVALGRLGDRLGRIAVITGRPAATAVRLGRFRGVVGLGSMVVLGQYGVERWDAGTDRFVLPPEPPEIRRVAAELPAILTRLGLDDARIEHKGRAIGVHTRELADSAAALERLAAPLEELATRHGLLVEPGRKVLEIRARGIDKGAALRDLVTETGARAVVFIGDDLGDLPAFRAVEQLRTEGVEGLLICSASHEENALSRIADLVVDGPDGVAGWLSALADRLHGEPQHADPLSADPLPADPLRADAARR